MGFRTTSEVVALHAPWNPLPLLVPMTSTAHHLKNLVDGDLVTFLLTSGVFLAKLTQKAQRRDNCCALGAQVDHR
jgi:hypothetical protein